MLPCDELRTVFICVAVIRLANSNIQQDNDLNYCVCLKLLLQFHFVLFCSLEVINSLLWQAAECQPAAWLNSLLQSGPVRRNIAPEDFFSKFVNDMLCGKKHILTQTSNTRTEFIGCQVNIYNMKIELQLYKSISFFLFTTLISKKLF